MNLLWGKSGTALFDIYSLHHIVWFIAITLLLYAVFRKYAWLGAISIAFMWEIFEQWVVNNVPDFPYAGNEMFINKVIGDTISDLIGFLIAMVAIWSIKGKDK